VTQKVTAVVGLSGVGKTSVLSTLSSKRKFQHLSASRLIRDARRLWDMPGALDTLRSANIGENQRLLIEGFRRAIDSKAAHVVLDGHTVVEAPSGLIVIEPTVFRELQIASMIFLADNAVEIARRRANDITRSRAVATLEGIQRNQEAALLAAFQTCSELKIPLTVVTVDHIDHLEGVLFGTPSSSDVADP